MSHRLSVNSIRRQAGLSLVGLLFWTALLGSAAVVGAQVFPTVVEYQTIMKVLNRVKTERTVNEIRSAFSRATEIDNIHSLKPGDLDITKNNEKVEIRFAYENEIHLFGPAYLTLKYRGEVK
jgi:predicted transcriptional regulator